VIKTVDRLADVSSCDWDHLAGDDGFYLSFDWLRFVETEGLAEPRYLLSIEEGALRGALTLYRAGDAVTPLYRSERFSELLGIDGAILLAGTCRGYRSTLLLSPSAADRAATLATLVASALDEARRAGCAGIVLPFLTTDALLEVASAAAVRAAFDIPESEIADCGLGLDAYAERAPGRMRRRIRSDLARFAGAGWAVRERALDDCWQEAARLLHALRQKYGHTGRSLQDLQDSLAGQVSLLGGRSVVFTCEDEHGIAGLALGYRWRRTVFGRLAGFDYDRLRDGREYFMVTIYTWLRYAKSAGIERLHLGVGSWEAKGYRGAVLRPLWSAFIPVEPAGEAPGLTLINDDSVRQWITDITQRGIRIDHEEWRAPGRLAAAQPGPG
jgi:hypothetical protein